MTFARFVKLLKKHWNISFLSVLTPLIFGLNLKILVKRNQRTKETRLWVIILGILDQEKDMPNYFIILGKLYLWSCRKNNRIPLFTLFDTEACRGHAR